MNEMVLPLPCAGTEEAQDSMKQFHKIWEEFEELRSALTIESIKGRGFDRTNEEAADVITACITFLEIRGLDEKARSELFAKVNEKNRARGYLD